MALTKVNRGGLNTGISDSSNATFLTVDSSEQAVIKSEGGAVTTSVQQGLCKSWCQWNNAGTPTASDSLNLSSITDTATGRPDLNFTNNMNNASYAASGFGKSGYSMMWDHASTSQIGVIIWYGSYYDGNLVSYMIQGDLA
jgi:hypothetical protein